MPLTALPADQTHCMLLAALLCWIGSCLPLSIGTSAHRCAAAAAVSVAEQKQEPHLVWNQRQSSSNK